MKIKKKLFSMAVSLVMMIGLAGVIPEDTFAFYVDYRELSIGYNTICTSDDSSSYYYYYTPGESGAFYFDLDFDISIVCLDDVIITPIVNADYSQYNLEAGNTYRFYFENYDYDISYYSLEFYEVNYNKLGELRVGNSVVDVNNVISTQTYYYFKPDISGRYKITSYNSNSDPKVLVTDANSNIFYCFDDEGSNDANYSAVMDLNSNQSYFFSFYDYGTAYQNNINISYIPPSSLTTVTKPSIVPKTTHKPKSAINKTNVKKVSKPAKVKFRYSFNPKTKKIKFKWKKVKGASGYQYKITADKKQKKKSTKKKSFSFKMKINKKYKFSIRAYKKFNGRKVYGKWSTKKIKLKLV